MTQASPSSPKCAFCKRWNGNAQLTNRGAGKGFVFFNNSATGKCMAGQNHIDKRANEGSGCKNYAISPEADRFV